MIPQTDPRAGYLAQKAEIDDAIRRVMDGGWYILGSEVAAFEREFAAYLGVGHVVGVANGTDALVLALRAGGIAPGDRVATVAHTAVATVAAIELAGAVPVLVDIELGTCTMDPASLERTLAAQRIRAVLPVHLYGQAADLGAIADLARRHGAILVEDCAQCHGARLGGKRLGSLGAAAAFSFYPTKNLGAFGDGGAVATDDPAIAERLRALREYGWRERYVSDIAGVNSRLDELQAAILRVRLARLDADNERRAAIAASYDAALPCPGPERRAGGSHVFHQYVVRVADRNGVRERLKARGVGSNVHYPVPVHLQPAYRDRLRVNLPHTEAAAREVLSLPIYPQLGDEAVQSTIAALRAAIA